jgi:hypothetical protein
MRTIKYILLLFVCATPELHGQPLSGLDALVDIDGLPRLRRGTSAHQVSSFERNGGNDDRNSWLYQDTVGDYVIFDDIGAGCIYRLWMTHGGVHPDYKDSYGSTRIKIYVDDDETPRYEATINDFFSGTLAPFLFPLAGNQSVSSGGYYSYVPIPYETRCRIALTDIPPIEMRERPWGHDSYWYYYNITYHKYSSADGVVSWTGLENYQPILDMWLNAGVDPKDSSKDIVISDDCTVASGEVYELVHIAGEGALDSIEFEMPQMSRDDLNNLWLKIFWDDQVQAAVEVPFGQFFGSGFGNVPVDGLLVGMQSNRYYCYFPMPFWQSFRIELDNRGDTDLAPISYNLGIESRSYDRNTAGYFHARHSTGSYTNYVESSDFKMLQESGRGHLLGVTLSCTGAGGYYGNGLSFLEGDERIYIDGSLTPQLHGTGNEDYFNGGWYYNRGVFTLPLHGSPVRSSPFSMSTETNYVGAYRLHLGDLVPFNSSIEFGIEHGGENKVGCHMEAVSYFYKLAGNTNGLIACGAVDIGDPVSEASAGYAVSGPNTLQTNSFHYTGDDHHLVLSDVGRYMESGSSGFSVSIPVLNDGVLIRRRADAGAGRQQASVFVDNDYVADWYFADTGFSNIVQRWVDCEFYVPYQYTAGKDSLLVRFETSPGEGTWSEYAYSVYAVSQMGLQFDMDVDGIADQWETSYFSNLTDCESDDDLDEDGFSNHDEYICLTHPRDDTSFFSLRPAVGEDYLLSFPTALSRSYDVYCTTNLAAGSWQRLFEISGTGEEYAVTVPENDDNACFYRVSVRLY